MSSKVFDANYFTFECIKDILEKNYGEELSCETEKDLDPKYIRAHGPIVTILYRNVRVPLTIYHGKGIFRNEVVFLANRLKIKNDILRKIAKDCLQSKMSSPES